jgi:hypothetical protein
MGIIQKLDTKIANGKVHTFLDDLVASIAANASSRLAHRLRDKQERLTAEEIAQHENEEKIG